MTVALVSYATTRSTVDVAHELGIPHTTLWRWTRDWGHPDVGSGRRIRLEPWEVRIARAWLHLWGQRGGMGIYQLQRVRTYRRIVADQLRANTDARVLLLTQATANVFDTAEQAARWWLDHGQALGVGHIFDLEAVPWTPIKATA